MGGNVYGNADNVKFSFRFQVFGENGDCGPGCEENRVVALYQRSGNFSDFLFLFEVYEFLDIESRVGVLMHRLDRASVGSLKCSVCLEVVEVLSDGDLCDTKGFGKFGHLYEAVFGYLVQDVSPAFVNC